MIHIIKMDMYRLFKTKSAWIILILSMLFTLFSVSFIGIDIDDMKENQSYNNSKDYDSDYYLRYGNDAEINIHNMNIGIMIHTNDEWCRDGYKISVWELFNANAASRIFIIFIGIATAIFVRAEQKRGYIKAIAGLLPSRAGLAFSKFFTTGVYTIILFAANTAVAAVSSKLTFGYINFGHLKEFIPTTLTLLLLHISISALVTAICIFTNSSGLTICISAILGSGMIECAYSLINFIIAHYFGIEKFNIMRYVISCNAAVMGEQPQRCDFIRACIVSVMFIAVCMSSGIYLMKKRDVK